MKKSPAKPARRDSGVRSTESAGRDAGRPAVEYKRMQSVRAQREVVR